MLLTGLYGWVPAGGIFLTKNRKLFSVDSEGWGKMVEEWWLRVMKGADVLLVGHYRNVLFLRVGSFGGPAGEDGLSGDVFAGSDHWYWWGDGEVCDVG